MKHSLKCLCLQFYSEAELRGMEGGADEVHAKAAAGRLPKQCFHETRGRGGALKRTKFFFGARCKHPSSILYPHLCVNLQELCPCH